MILEFGFSNFYSFKESAQISFRLDKNCPIGISNGYDFTNVLGIKGANGSGKTQLLKALTFLGGFCSTSFSYKPDENIGLSPFFSSKEDTEFYIEFIVKSSSYRYELVLNNSEVTRETLYRTTKKKTKLFDRIGQRIENCIAAYDELNSLKIRKNVSIISSAHQYEVAKIKEIYGFFNGFCSNVFSSGHEDWLKIETSARYLNQSKKALSFVTDFISACDVGVSEIEIRKREDKDGKETFYPAFCHKVADKKYYVTDTYESSGTKTLFKWLPLYYLTLATGGLLVMDEMDMNLHPHILPKIIELFLDKKINSENAQLVFATHDSEILELLGRYRTQLVSKEENESFTYRLDQIPGDILRNDRAIRPVYNSGRIGGVPKL